MVDFSALHFAEGVPIYLQMIAHVKRGIVGGGIADGDELPSRRVLSVALGVNPNTVQKAYRMLEDEGLLASRSGAKSYIQASDTAIATLRKELLGGEISAMVAAVKAMGLTKQEGVALFATLWEED